MKHCLYGFESNSIGCPVCKCRAISRIEAKLTIPEKIGRLAGWDKCVSLSPTGRVVERDGGEWWSDGCRHCFCEQKQEYCSLISCAPRPADCAEENWVHEEGACCSSCMSTANKSAVLTSKHEHTVCQSPGSGRIFTGASWRTDDCTSCECTAEGKVICYRQQCDDDTACNGKPLTIKGRCCPVCEDALSAAVCSFDSSVYSVGEEWRQDTCTNCS
ncbi:unnamed protein product, partial [Cylicostephanus goldi]